ncbi:nesprin-1 isoform X1 [Micropterus dolomieu]|uniref:nesprin-1 isoform X1 n=1 Tax=Micropterus dolomieu TaxID=147949 RepID=UPI001E8EB2DA|nr:nesprin-1 isoform X1 [Micropterus dolomieu]XP_045930791.1 nesprin-1 isoform X1 [Micropterus dolomieu]
MPGFPADPPFSELHGGAIPTTEGSDVVPAEDVSDMEPFLDLSESPFLPTSSPLELNGEETRQVDGSWSQDGDLQGCGSLERRWVLWHQFMKEHALLDTWLRLAEQAVSSSNPAHITFVTAKEEQRKFERLRCEAGSRLVQLDSLTRRNRALTRLFQGSMQARLLASTRECGQRWDNVNAKLESITRQLKLFVSEWEGFEAERDELALWLADLDVRLTEVDHQTGNTCEKLRRLQSFQQCVCVNSGRVNALLGRGEALIQRSQPADAQHVESRLLELLQRCSLVYNNIARTHTRLLSMRLVFEDDWILSQASDSGCPSEGLLEEEGALDKSNLDLPAISNHPKDFSQSANLALAISSDPPEPMHLPPPPSPSSPTHEHLGLEWDPSVDIGRSVSRDDADSSYFSIRTGLCHRDGLKRRSYLSSLGSQSDISNDNQEAELRGWTRLSGDQWATSTPDGQHSEPVGFDGRRVRAWLGVQSPATPARRTSCSKAVQTDGEVKGYLHESHIDALNQLRPHLNNSQQPLLAPSSSPSQDLNALSDWMKYQNPSNPQCDLQQQGPFLSALPGPPLRPSGCSACSPGLPDLGHPGAAVSPQQQVPTWLPPSTELRQRTPAYMKTTLMSSDKALSSGSAERRFATHHENLDNSLISINPQARLRHQRSLPEICRECRMKTDN